MHGFVAFWRALCGGVVLSAKGMEALGRSKGGAMARQPTDGSSQDRRNRSRDDRAPDARRLRRIAGRRSFVPRARSHLRVRIRRDAWSR